MVSAPTNVTVTASSENENTITHDQVSDASAYNYYRGEAPASWPDDFTKIGQNTSNTDTDFVDNNVPEDGEKYEYVVTSVADTSEADSFEDGNLDGWTKTPSDSDWAASQTQAVDGSWSAHKVTSGVSGSLLRDPNSTVTRVEGYIYSADEDNSQNSYPGVKLAVQSDNSGGYVTNVDEYNNEFRLTVIGGSHIATATVTVDANTWYYLILKKSGSDLTAEIYDDDPDSGGTLLKSLLGSDSQYNGTKYGVSAYRESYFDKVYAEW